MRRVCAAVLFLAFAAACSQRPDASARQATTSSTPAAAMPTPASPTPAASPTPTPERFYGEVAEIDSATSARMTSSWRPGCPVPLGDLRLIRLVHWGLDGRVKPGELVVHEDHADAILGVFEDLFAARFPIRRMELVDVYGGDDDRSMAANNTSAFNCRPSSGDAGTWSQHAYGLAIDINPIQNPYVATSGAFEPPAGERYVDRTEKAAGMIRPGDVVVRAFAKIGWSWGGYWSSAKDYQHFSSNGR